ncbi:MAG: hypothetical protein ACOVP4_06210 [Bacteriovoracaceae bacterium]
MSIVFYLILILLLAIWALRPEKPVISLTESGNGLEDWLKKFHWSGPALQTKIELPRYKFFSDLVEMLLSQARQWGAQYQQVFITLREILHQDLQFEKQLKEFVQGCWFQMGLIVVMSWLFIILGTMWVEIKFPLKYKIMIGFWQALGMMSFFFGIRQLKTRYLSALGAFWKSLICLRSLAETALPRSEVVRLSQIKSLDQYSNHEWNDFKHKVQHLGQWMLSSGQSPVKEIGYLMEELRFLEKHQMAQFQKMSHALKFAILVIFFIPAYFAFLFIIFSNLGAMF